MKYKFNEGDYIKLINNNYISLYSAFKKDEEWWFTNDVYCPLKNDIFIVIKLLEYKQNNTILYSIFDNKFYLLDSNILNRYETI